MEIISKLSTLLCTKTVIMIILTIAILCFGLNHQVLSQKCPLVLGHRGSAGIYPEHTLLGYEKGADMGADFIECDIQITKVNIL
jgi:glycerophosphoryl diester phosphodiesterase